MEPAQWIAYILSGLAAGAASGALGIGGGVIATPLLRLLGVAPYLAVGTTVLAILPSTVTGAWTYSKSGHLDLKSALWAALAGGPAAFAGARATRAMNGHVLMIMTAAVLLVLALGLLAPQRNDSAETTGPDGDVPDPSRRGLSLMGGAAGFSSGLLGIGGGFLMVPALTRWFAFPLKKALGTSLAAISLIIPVNLIGQSQAGNVDWTVAALLTLGIIPGAALGAAASIKSSDRVLRRTVAVVLSILALLYAGFELAALSS